MLGRDLLRVREKGPNVEPLWLGKGPSICELADQLLSLWRGSIGGSRAEINDLIPPIIQRAHSQIMGRGLNKLIGDACTFADTTDLRTQRQAAFDASAQRLLNGPRPQASEHRQHIALELDQELGDNADDPLELYADLPNRAKLETAPNWDATELLERYNMHLAQGLLLSANSVRVTIQDTDSGLRRRLLKAMRWHRLLAEVNESGDGFLEMVISGPGSVLDQRSRYGLELACFLPHLATAKTWQLEAQVTPPKSQQRETRRLTLDHTAPLQGHSHFLAHTPPEIANCHQAWGDKLKPWEVSNEAPLLPMGKGDLAVPDFQFKNPTNSSAPTLYLECLHRWHRRHFEQRLKQLESGIAPNLLLAVDRALVRSGHGKDLLEASSIQPRIMLFNDLPTATAVQRLLKGLE